MTEELVPGEVKAFIGQHIDSVTQLEALLLLRAEARQAWDVSMVAKRLYATDFEVLEVLRIFVRPAS